MPLSAASCISIIPDARQFIYLQFCSLVHHLFSHLFRFDRCDRKVIDHLSNSVVSLHIATSKPTLYVSKAYIDDMIKDLHWQSPQDRDLLTNLAGPPISPLTWNHRCRHDTPIWIDQMHDEHFEMARFCGITKLDGVYLRLEDLDLVNAI